MVHGGFFFSSSMHEQSLLTLQHAPFPVALRECVSTQLNSTPESSTAAISKSLPPPPLPLKVDTPFISMETTALHVAENMQYC